VCWLCAPCQALLLLLLALLLPLQLQLEPETILMPTLSDVSYHQPWESTGRRCAAAAVLLLVCICKLWAANNLCGK